MCLRISSTLLLLSLLTACGGQSPLPPGDAIDCAIGAVAELAPVCTLEKVAGTQEIVLHHPDGGFRRLARDPANDGFAPLDGAEPLISQSGEDAVLQFAIGADRYRIPRTMLDPPAP